jgi:hypothetical protein
LLRWAWLLVLWLWRVPSAVERKGRSLGRRVVQLDLLEFEVVVDDVKKGNDYDRLMKIFI